MRTWRIEAEKGEAMKRVTIAIKVDSEQTINVIELLMRLVDFLDEAKAKGFIADYKIGLEANITWVLKTGAEILRKAEAEAEKGPEPIPEFDPDELLKHEWKGKRKTTGEGHEPGSLSWGWDKKDQFSEAVIQVLEKGPLTIGEYEFGIDDARNLVYARKAKGG